MKTHCSARAQLPSFQACARRCKLSFLRLKLPLRLFVFALLSIVRYFHVYAIEDRPNRSLYSIASFEQDFLVPSSVVMRVTPYSWSYALLHDCFVRVVHCARAAKFSNDINSAVAIIDTLLLPVLTCTYH